MTYLFFIQGEGRGHMTQALTLKEKLEKRGHKISAIVIGAKNQETIPAFFKEQVNCPLFTVYSPTFTVDKKGQGINMPKSILNGIFNSPQYFKSIIKTREVVKTFNPDALISFYEPLVGSYLRLSRDKRRAFFIGHQYFMGHPVFKKYFPKKIIRTIFSFYNSFNAPRKRIKIALSFANEKDCPKKNLFVCPPLIREVIKKSFIKEDDFFLAYLLNKGYSQEIINWSKDNPNIKIEAFWNKPEQEITIISPCLTFHHLGGQKFIDYLASCSGYISTAGFDSIAEAAYLQKNIIMVPTKNHFEQKCNAVDAVRTGIATEAEHFDLSLTKNENETRKKSLITFKDWVDEFDNKIIEIIETKN